MVDAACTNAATCSVLVTFGSVTTKASRDPRDSASVATKWVSVRTPRARVGFSKDLTRMPVNGGRGLALLRLGEGVRRLATWPSSSSSLVTAGPT